jgi:predicted MFS family arabinose efflux permease
MTLSGFLYLVPSLPVVFLTRVGHGVAWAAFNTGSSALLASLVPATRRGEAAGIWSLLPGIATAVMPAAGLALLATYGFGAPFLAAVLLAAAGVVVAIALPRRNEASEQPAAAEPGELIDRRAVGPMAIELVWATTQALFMTFPPVIASERGIPLDLLPTYYLVVGIALIGSRVAASRIMDRVSRRRALLAGVVLGSAGLAIGLVADDIALLTIAGCLYVAGSAAILPASMAMVLDAAGGQRTGAAMATYSLGHQLGLGAGALVTGFLLDRAGADLAFLAGFAASLAVAVLAVRLATPGRAGHAMAAE